MKIQIPKFNRLCFLGRQTVAIISIFAAVLISGQIACATINITHEYNFGETNVANILVPGPLIDSVGTSDMNKLVNSPFYRTNAPSLGRFNPMSLDFASGGRFDTLNGSLWGTAIDNFGMQAWVLPASTFANQGIFINGYSTGIQGIYQSGSEYHFMLDNITYDFNVAISGLGTWDHVALVRDNGITTFYLNGIAAAVTNVSIAGVPNAHSFIGQGSPGVGGGQYYGMINTMNYFTFAPGEFSTADLFYYALPVPEPSTYALFAAGVIGILIAMKRKKTVSVDSSSQA